VPIVLYRVDERLVHGQVVIGWGSQLHPDRYVVVDDDLSQSQWEQDLYRLGAGGAEVVFSGCTEARGRLAEWRDAPQRTILLTRDVATMSRLAEGGALNGESIVLGGVHPAPGRREALTYVHLTEKEMADLAVIAAAGADVFGGDLPDSQRVDLDHLRRRWNSSN